MAKKKSKLTRMQQEYLKQIKRIENAVMKANKSGQEIPEDFIPKMPKRVTQEALKKAKNTKVNAPKGNPIRNINTDNDIKIPHQPNLKPRKEIAPRKSKEEIREIRLKNLEKAREKRFTNLGIFKEQDGYIYDTRTGEIIKAPAPHPTTQPTPQPPQQNNDYIPVTDTVISNFRWYIKGFPSRISDKVLNWLDNLISTAGVNRVAQMLEDNSSKLSDYLTRTGYDSEGAVVEYCTDMLNYLPEMTDNDRADLMEDFESEDGTGWSDGEWDE
jgi:hypothetical protein